MNSHHIGAVINFTTNEARFLNQCLAEVGSFASEVIVPICSHFFDGQAEDRSLLAKIYAAHPKTHFIEYPFEKSSYSPTHWHNVSRLVGLSELSEEIDWLLFLDADEIVEGRRFLEWLNGFPLDDYAALQMACYWYFRSPRWRSARVEDSPLLIKRSAITYEGLMHPHERRGLFHLVQDEKMTFVSKKTPLFHHYSWVRTKEEMVRKVKSWGHRAERDWVDLVQREFSTPFSYREFVHGEPLHEVDPFLKEREYGAGEGSAKRLTSRDVHKREILLKLQE
jgi:hypothetical protein